MAGTGDTQALHVAHVEYYVQWKGNNGLRKTWEPEEKLECPDLIKAFEEAHKNPEDTARPVPRDGLPHARFSDEKQCKDCKLWTDVGTHHLCPEKATARAVLRDSPPYSRFPDENRCQDGYSASGGIYDQRVKELLHFARQLVELDHRHGNSNCLARPVLRDGSPYSRFPNENRCEDNHSASENTSEPGENLDSQDMIEAVEDVPKNPQETAATAGAVSRDGTPYIRFPGENQCEDSHSASEKTSETVENSDSQDMVEAVEDVPENPHILQQWLGHIRDTYRSAAASAIIFPHFSEIQ